MRRRLRVLDPCDEDFESMSGDATARFCDRCAKNVHDLSAMTRTEGERLVATHAGREVCLRYRVDARGEIVFRREPTRMGFVAAMAVALAACTGHLDADELESPGDRAICYDADGFAVHCDEVDYTVVPFGQAAEPSTEPQPREQDLGEVDVPDLPPPTPRPPAVDAEAPTAQGCPVRPHSTSPKTPGARRRAERRARRADRRRRRRRPQTTMGVVVVNEPF